VTMKLACADLHAVSGEAIQTTPVMSCTLHLMHHGQCNRLRVPRSPTAARSLCQLAELYVGFAAGLADVLPSMHTTLWLEHVNSNAPSRRFSPPFNTAFVGTTAHSRTCSPMASCIALSNVPMDGLAAGQVPYVVARGC
jgi:hypothetical protein